MLKVNQVTTNVKNQTVYECLMIKAIGAMIKGIITCKIGRCAEIKAVPPGLLDLLFPIA